jgi:hypothetical protein
LEQQLQELQQQLVSAAAAAASQAAAEAAAAAATAAASRDRRYVNITEASEANASGLTAAEQQQQQADYYDAQVAAGGWGQYQQQQPQQQQQSMDGQAAAAADSSSSYASPEPTGVWPAADMAATAAATDQQQQQFVTPSPSPGPLQAPQQQQQQQPAAAAAAIPDIATLSEEQLRIEGLRLLRTGRAATSGTGSYSVTGPDFAAAEAFLQAAVACFAAAVESEPQDTRALGNLGNALLAQGELKKSLLDELRLSAAQGLGLGLGAGGAAVQSVQLAEGRLR